VHRRVLSPEHDDHLDPGHHLEFGVTLGTATTVNQIALYTQVTAGQPGTT
jgi:hypothetical protein